MIMMQTKKSIRQTRTSANSTNRSWACGANPRMSSPSTVIASATRTIQRINANCSVHCHRRKRLMGRGMARISQHGLLCYSMFEMNEKSTGASQCHAQHGVIYFTQSEKISMTNIGVVPHAPISGYSDWMKDRNLL